MFQYTYIEELVNHQYVSYGHAICSPDMFFLYNLGSQSLWEFSKHSGWLSISRMHLLCASSSGAVQTTTP
jgi:hypothetical protein